MKFKKIQTKLINAILLLLLLVLLPSSVKAMSEGCTTKRLGGQDRFATAIEISKEFAANSKKPIDSVILCSAYGYADSISATQFAVYVNAPILLTEKDTLPQETQDRINKMNVKKVYIIGGTGSISENVLSDLKNMGLTVERIGGYNRYETNRAVIAKIPQNLWGKSPKFVNGFDPYGGIDVAFDTIDKDDTNLINLTILNSGDFGNDDDYGNNSSYVTNIVKILNDKYKDNFDFYCVGSKGLGAYTAPFGNKGWTWAQYTNPNKHGDWIRGLTEKDGTINITWALSLNSLFKNKFKLHPFATNSIFLTGSSSYIDSLCVGPLSAITYSPIVYYDANYSFYSSHKSDYLEVQNVYYVGGTGVVPDGTESIFK